MYNQWNILYSWSMLIQDLIAMDCICVIKILILFFSPVLFRQNVELSPATQQVISPIRADTTKDWKTKTNCAYYAIGIYRRAFSGIDTNSKRMRQPYCLCLFAKLNAVLAFCLTQLRQRDRYFVIANKTNIFNFIGT